ncbi:MAG: L-2-amino-thiazoline-4-carboxylic acid hydrolase [Deltaproteobacteria bacterium]|nr:L-2-amino-thiazoline-4-carboxylic acid hydrolase [Deltaproteobacteria bacterium]
MTNLLEQRRIEGEIIRPVFDVLKERYGRTEAEEIMTLAIQKAARESGLTEAQKMGGGSLLKFIALQPRWQADQALETNVLDQSEDRFDYNVTYCAYAEMYQKTGLKELGFILSCNRDLAFIEGFAPDIELKRTKTLMEGADFCDFRYCKKQAGK